MKLYELTYLPLPGISEDDQKALLERVIAALETAPVSQQSNGFFSTIDFNSEPEKIKEIEGKIKDEKQVQRCLILKKNPVKFKARSLRRAEFSKKNENRIEKPKIELQEIEKKLDEILKD